MDIFKELYNLAQERASHYPLKLYPNRHEFDKKLDEFALLMIKKSESIVIDKQVLPLCEKFRNNPVFICGYYKSGTSLLNSLLDSHSQAFVLLPGSKVLFDVRNKAEKLSKDEFFHYLAREYIKALYNPTGHLPMNLLSYEKYAEFASYLKHFIENAQTKAELLSALPCALFSVSGQMERGDKPFMWVEKSVTNERHIKKAKQIFPNAKFIYIARNPYDNLASIKRWYINSGRKNVSSVYLYFWRFKESLKKGLKLSQRDDFRLIRYEDIVSQPQKQMRNITEFLRINYTESILTPTILGVPDRPNTSDTEENQRKVSGTILKSRVSKYKQTLTESEIKDITILFSNLMKKLGYEPEPLSVAYIIFKWRFLMSRIIISNIILKFRNRR